MRAFSTSSGFLLNGNRTEDEKKNRHKEKEKKRETCTAK